MTLIRFLTALFITASIINFGWEVSQMPLYAFSGVTAPEYGEFIKLHWITAFKDGIIVVALYVLVGILVRNAAWGKRFNYRRLLFLASLGALWAAGIEYHAVFVAHRWAYGFAMPLLPAINIGVAPVVQMIIVPFISVMLARRQLSEK